MDNAVIYKTLKHFKNKDVVTSDELIRKRYFHKNGSESLSSRLNELHMLGYIAANKKNGVITAKITPVGKNFITDYKYQRHLTNLEKWIERFIGFVMGVITSVAAGIILHLLNI
ncbi:MAG: hypothetical protein IJN64_10955 [Lachnospiraceae bacterium]|nr:hypothetical protein [Lachnospiraceae bacterium]